MPAKRIVDTINRFRDDIISGKYPTGSLLPSEKELSSDMKLSRPTVAKIYNTLQQEGLIKKTPGQGTSVIYSGDAKKFTFGLLLPGAGESEIFGVIHDHFLAIEKEMNVKFLWDGSIANNAQVRQNTILKISEDYAEQKVNGVFFAPLERTESAESINHKVCDFFSKKNIPIILIDRDIEMFPKRSKYHVIGLDNFNAGYVMTNHLIQSGCENIIFFYRNDSASSVRKRINGCLTACFDAGIDFTSNHIVAGDPADIQLVDKINIVSGKTGVLCANDSTAAVIMASFKQIGIMVSEQILVAGFDDMRYGKVLQPTLTTYRQPLIDIVTISYEMMLNRISSQQDEIAADINLLGEVIGRESSKFR